MRSVFAVHPSFVKLPFRFRLYLYIICEVNSSEEFSQGPDTSIGRISKRSVWEVEVNHRYIVTIGKALIILFQNIRDVIIYLQVVH